VANLYRALEPIFLHLWHLVVILRLGNGAGSCLKFYKKKIMTWKDWVLPDGPLHIRIKVSSTDLWEDINWWCHFLLIQTCFEGSATSWCILLFGCAMEGSMIFCQKNILEHSMKLNGDYLKRWLLTHRVSQILLPHKANYWNKVSTMPKRLFTTKIAFVQLTFRLGLVC
jgi:hypothetical protein